MVKLDARVPYCVDISGTDFYPLNDFTLTVTSEPIQVFATQATKILSTSTIVLQIYSFNEDASLIWCWFLAQFLLFLYSSHKNSQPIVHLTEEEIENILTCYTTMMYTMSTFEDWRVNLAQLLQSVPFPDQAQTNQKFIK